VTDEQRQAISTLQRRYDDVRVINLLLGGLHAVCYREDGSRDTWQIDRAGVGTLAQSTENLAEAYQP
jgi:hypothetical protein